MNMDAKVNGKEQPPKLQKSGFMGNENGDCLSKMPTATAEQLTLAKILSKPDTDANLRQYVIQLQELTKCSEDQAVTALYDCENNLERAVDLLLDKFRCGIEEEEWHTRVRKRGKTKHSVPSEVPDQVVVSSGTLRKPSNHSRKSEKVTDDEKRVSESKSDSPVLSPVRNSSVEEVLPVRRVSNHSKKTSVRNKGRVENNEKHRLPQTEKGVSAMPSVIKATSYEHKNQDDSDVWDPYTDCGEWEGEPIEIVNSNALIAMGLQEASSFPSDMFQESVSEVEKDDKESLPDSHGFVDTVQVMAKTADAMDGDELFVTVARTKAPPRAFVNMPNVPLFIAPELLPDNSFNWKPTFGDVSFGSVLTQNMPDLTSPNRGQGDREDKVTPNATTSRVQSEQVDLGSKQFYPNQVAHQAQPSGFELKSPSSIVMLDGPSKNESKQNVIVPDFQAQCFDEPVVPKPPTSYPSNYKKQPSPMLASNSSDQGTYLEPAMKNYLLDNMSDGVGKLNVGDAGAQNPKNQTYSMHQSSTQTQSTLTSFPQTQNSSGVPQMVKLTISNPISHIGQTQSMSANSQTHQQQSTLPPGMPHFISQFAPTPYHMFNLPGGSGTGPLFDLDQLQLLQQHRMLYDVHVQHQAATTAQSLLTPNADSTLSGKSLNHNLPAQTGHVTAASTNIRPDMLPPTIGHAPYFPYSGFVLMNGYPNAYLNQQQQQSNSDNPQGQNSGHCGSPIAQHQPQQSNPSQPYNNLKQLGGSVTKYDDLLEMKYSDGLKQVGFKPNASQPNYGSFQSQGLPMDNVGTKISATHSNSGPINQNYNHTNSGAHTQHFPPQFYPSTPSPYLTVFAAAAAAVSVKQASNNNAAVSASQPNPNGGVVASQSNQMHLTANPNQGMVLGASNSNLHHHHQRAPIPHQH